LWYKHIKISIFFVLLCIGFMGYSILLSFAGSIEIKNPHREYKKSFQKECKSCHSSDPLLSLQWEDTIHSKECQIRCNSCHTVPESCRLVSTEKASQVLKSQLRYLGIPLFSGLISCRSCHFFHQQDTQQTNEKRLNNFYPGFWYRAQQIEPHQSGVFCQLCHETSIGVSADNPQLKFQGDLIAVCIQCHNGRKAKADNHPIRIKPSKEKGVTIPDGFPLRDGKLTCLTCHKMPCQGGKIETKFLRGGPYEKRVDACLVCHSKERYQSVNPHIQIDPNGKIMKNKCLYCHII